MNCNAKGSFDISRSPLVPIARRPARVKDVPARNGINVRVIAVNWRAEVASLGMDRKGFAPDNRKVRASRTYIT